MHLIFLLNIFYTCLCNVRTVELDWIYIFEIFVRAPAGTYMILDRSRRSKSSFARGYSVNRFTCESIKFYSRIWRINQSDSSLKIPFSKNFFLEKCHSLKISFSQNFLLAKSLSCKMSFSQNIILLEKSLAKIPPRTWRLFIVVRSVGGWVGDGGTGRDGTGRDGGLDVFWHATGDHSNFFGDFFFFQKLSKKILKLIQLD